MEGFFWQRSVLVFYTISLQEWRWTDERTQIFSWGVTVLGVVTQKYTTVTSLCSWSHSCVGEMVFLRPGLNCDECSTGASELGSCWHLPWQGGVSVGASERSRFVLKRRVLGGCCSTELLWGNRAVCLAFTASVLCCMLEVCLCEPTKAIKSVAILSKTTWSN